MKKRILSFFCACLLLFTALSSLGTFATEPESGDDCPTVEELAYTARMAMHFNWFLYDGIYTLWRAHYEFGFSFEDDDADFSRWLVSKGLFPETLESKEGSELPPLTDLHTGQVLTDLDYITCYALPSGITMKEVKEAYFSLFYYDVCNAFECTVNHKIYGEPGGRICEKGYFREDSDGRVYMTCIGNCMLPDEIDAYTDEAVWNSMQITYKDSQKIIIESSPDIKVDFVGKITAEFRKNADGWRVYNCNTLLTNCPPPETGDNTPVFLTLTALSVLGFCALAVTVGRKKKERL